MYIYSKATVTPAYQIMEIFPNDSFEFTPHKYLFMKFNVLSRDAERYVEQIPSQVVEKVTRNIFTIRKFLASSLCMNVCSFVYSVLLAGNRTSFNECQDMNY